ncbi:MAG: PH domain-containing protein [Candidatus Aenigmatarchaeota archaeon]
MAYPEIKIASSVYIITRENIIEIKGIITKRKTVIPFTSISHVVMNKTIGGIIMGYGDIIISSYRDVCIVFEGISNAEKITEIIEKRVESEKRI